MPEIRAIVWVADGEATEKLDYGDRLVERLTDQGMYVDRHDLAKADPADPPTADLHVLTGGATPVHDATGWMPHGLALTSALADGARRGRHTLVGVCLGSQMIAETLSPGNSVRASDVIEVGLTTVRLRLEGREESVVVPSFHYEQILPRVLEGGAELVADNAHSPVQGFRYGPHVWGVQFHPELDPADTRHLVDHHRDTVETYHSSVAEALDSVDRHEARWSPKLFDRLFHRFLAGRRP